MKKLSLFLLLFSLVQVSDAQTEYMVISYHQMLPGYKMADATASEGAWKAIHRIRREAGMITEWAMYANYPDWGMFKTPDIEFDYITVSKGTNPDDILFFSNEMFGRMYAENPQLADSIEKPVSKIIWQEMMVNEAKAGTSVGSPGFQAGNSRPNHIYLFEKHYVKPDNLSAYQEFEKKMALVQEERVTDGSISGWSSWQRLLPTANNGNFEFTTISAFPTLGAFLGGTYKEETVRQVFDMSFTAALGKYITLRQTETSWTAVLVQKI
jgi:hypothetical protein